MCRGLVDTSPHCGSHGLWIESHRGTKVRWQVIHLYGARDRVNLVKCCEMHCCQQWILHLFG